MIGATAQESADKSIRIIQKRYAYVKTLVPA